MPQHATVAKFIADVLTNDHAGAIERWYCEDAETQENQGPWRKGRDSLAAQERRMLSAVAGVHSELVAPAIIDGDQVALRWRFRFRRADGAELTMEEVAWQTWVDDKIVRETFFYDPSQRVFVPPQCTGGPENRD